MDHPQKEKNFIGLAVIHGSTQHYQYLVDINMGEIFYSTSIVPAECIVMVKYGSFNGPENAGRNNIWR